MFSGSAIIVAHNSAGPIEQCLCALRKEEGWERIVVDNASRDDTIERVERADPDARIIHSTENLGFAGGVNRGARAASSDVLLILNPDAIPAPGAPTALAKALNEPGVGAVSGLLLGENGQADRGFVVRRFPTVAAMAAEAMLVNRLWPNNPWNHSYRCLDLDYTKIQEVEQPAGACLAVKREAFESIGGFDETFYPAWFEDVDFCRRLRDQRWEIVYHPEAVFTHSGGHSVNQLSLRDRQVFWYRNLLRYFRKHDGPASVATLRAAIALGMGLRSLAALVGAGPDRVSRADALRAYASVAREVTMGRSESSGPSKR